MPRVQISCFCSESVSTLDDRRLSKFGASDWVVLPACGHIFHQRCIRNWTTFQPEKNPACPICRTSTKLVSIHTNPMHRIRLQDVRLYFNEDPKSDSDSQFQQFDEIPEEIVSSDDEDQEEEEDKDEIVDGEVRVIGNQGGGENQARGVAGGGVGVEVLRVQLREMRNTLRTVKAERDNLLSLRDDIQNFEEASRAAIATVEELRIAVEGQEGAFSVLTEELASVTEERDQLQLGQPGLKEVIENLEEEQFNLCADIAEKDLKISDLERDLKKRELERVQQEDERRMEKMAWSIERSKLNKTIDSEGSAGADKLKKMKESLDEQEQKILELRCANDRLELTTKETLKKIENECNGKLEEAKLEVGAAKKTATIAQKDATEARDKARKIENANINWRIKYDKMKLQLSKSKSKNRIESPSPSPTLSQTPPTSPIKKKNYATEHSPGNPYSPEKPYRIASRLSNFTSAGTGSSSKSATNSLKRNRGYEEEEDEDEDGFNFSTIRAKGKGEAKVSKTYQEEEEEEKVKEERGGGNSSDSDVVIVESFTPSSHQPPRQKRQSSGSSSTGKPVVRSKPMITITDSSSRNKYQSRAPVVFGAKKVELESVPSDKHMPDFTKGKSVGISTKTKQRRV